MGGKSENEIWRQTKKKEKEEQEEEKNGKEKKFLKTSVKQCTHPFAICYAVDDTLLPSVYITNFLFSLSFSIYISASFQKFSSFLSKHSLYHTMLSI